MTKIDVSVGRKFAIVTGILMTRVFSTKLEANPRRLMFACGPATSDATFALPNSDLKFDVLGLGFRPGKEWEGPSEIFVQEMRGDELRIWTNCRLYASTVIGPIYVLTDDPDVCFSYDGNSLVPLSGFPEDHIEGVLRAKTLLPLATRRVPDGIEQHRMM
ncbi:hypothetical protein EJC47_00685 [Sphingomonas sp. TF3]|uniref:hypothetical protein n=1 Tax=Sphingomonas sp. TF3 TaxID=2495580 RepID=UPI000F870495|nr:hypothetical protein [Sphingomonas sp. TF3]RUN78425.1 hypothetical protein EJC47_00685 [Sphingomonas sp. TF3]